MSRGNCTNPKENFRLRQEEYKQKLKVECEWCGTAMTHIYGCKEPDEKGEIQCVGYCPKCCAKLWSKSAKPIEL